jgi:hypothetical protein
MKTKMLKLNLRVVASDLAGIKAALRALAAGDFKSNETGAPCVGTGFSYDYEFVHSDNLFSKDGKKKTIDPNAGMCERCGSGGATFDACPYASEIHGDDSPVWMCDDCRHQALQGL